MKNWKIGTRIGAGFAAVIVVAMTLGIFAYTRVGIIDADSTNITVHRLPTIYLIGQVQANAQANVGLMLRHMAAKDHQEMAGIEAEQSERLSRNTSLLQEYEKLITTDKGRELYAEIKSTRGEFNAVRDEAVALSRSGKKAEAAALVKGRMLPADAKYMEAIASVVSFNKTVADDDSRDIQAAVTGSRTGILLGLAVALIIAVTISLLVVRSIARPLATAVGLVNRVSQGDLAPQPAGG